LHITAAVNQTAAPALRDDDNRGREMNLTVRKKLVSNGWWTRTYVVHVARANRVHVDKRSALWVLFEE